ncbi:MAG: DUF4837 family protein [Alistipes sp.]
MKNSFLCLVCLVAMVGMSACDAFRTLSSTGSKTALGSPYEMILVCPQQAWSGAVGDTLRALFQAPVRYVNQDEPLFDVLRVLPRGFAKMVTEHRNILKVEIDPTLTAEQTTAVVEYNVRSVPQIMVTLQGANDAAVLQYLTAHGADLVYVFEKAERDRFIANALKFNEEHITEVLHTTFGIEMTVPKGYVLAKQEKDFVWCRLEYPQAGQGFCVYSYPYTGKELLTEPSLLAARNRFVSRVPGPSDNSHMTTSEAFTPDLRAFRLEGRAWIEMRGFWDVEGDFMGGPFVSYTTIDTATNRVITIDGYVFSPKIEKRNFLRSVEQLLYVVKFPTETAK